MLIRFVPSPSLTLWLICTLLTSHGKLYSALRNSPTHVRETSPVKGLTTFFPSYACLIYHGRSEQLWGLILIGRLAHDLWPRIKFLSVRPDFCLGLPSDSPSRGTPLPLAMRFPLFGCARDFHPLECANGCRPINEKRNHLFTKRLRFYVAEREGWRLLCRIIP